MYLDNRLREPRRADDAGRADRSRAHHDAGLRLRVARRPHRAVALARTGRTALARRRHRRSCSARRATSRASSIRREPASATTGRTTRTPTTPTTGSRARRAIPAAGGRTGTGGSTRTRARERAAPADVRQRRVPAARPGAGRLRRRAVRLESRTDPALRESRYSPGILTTLISIAEK